MPVPAKKYIAALAVILLLVLGMAYVALSRSTFYPAMVAERVAAAFADSGYTLKIKELYGNPLTGVGGSGVLILHEGAVVAAADEIEMRLLLISLLSGSPKLARLSFTKLKADYDVISEHLPNNEGDGSPSALDSFVLYDSIVRTRWGLINVKKGAIFIGPGGYRLGLSGKYGEFEAAFIATVSENSGQLVLSDLKARFGKARLSLSGELSPSISLSGSLERFDVAQIDAVPEVKEAGLSGIFDSRFLVNVSDDTYVSADISSEGGSFAGAVYEGLAADILYSKNILSISGIEANAFGAPLSGAAAVDFSSDKPDFSMKFALRSLDTASLRTGFQWAEDITGFVDALSCDISGPGDSLSGTARLSSDGLAISGFVLSDLKINALLKNSSSVSLSFSGEYFDASFSGSGDIGILPETSYNLNIAAAPLSIETIASRYPQVKSAGLSGVGKGTVKIKGGWSSPVFSGSVSFPALVVSDEYRLDSVRSEFEYSGSRLSLKDAEAVWNGALLKAAGAVRINASRNSDFSFGGSLSGLQLVSLQEFVPKLGEYKAQGEVSGAWGLSGSSERPIVSFDLSVPRLALAEDFVLSAVSASGSYRGGSLDLRSASFNYGKSKFSASGDMKFSPNSGSPTYNMKGSVEDLDPSVLRKLGILSDDLSGNMTADIRAWSHEGGEGVRAYFRSSDLSYDNLRFSGINGQVASMGGRLTFDKLRSSANIGNITVNGSINNIYTNNKDDIRLNLSAFIASGDIGRISRLVSAESRGYQGFINCSLDISGTAKNPKFSAGGNVRGVRAFGLFLPVIRFESAYGNKGEVHLPNVQAIVGRGHITLDADLAKDAGEWGAKISAVGRSVDIRSLTIPLDYEIGREILGALDFDFNGKGLLSSFEGSGMVRVPNLSVMGVKFTDFEAPFWLTDGFVVVEESTARAYGGQVSGQVVKDLRLSDWGGRIIMKNADMEALLKDIIPEAQGTVAGSADFKLFVTGDTKRTSMQMAEGSLEIKNGEVTGFKGTAAVSKLLGGRPLRFSKLLASFTVDGKTIYLLPGSRVQAPKGDPVFSYIMADGSVSMENDVDLYCVGNVNIRALNSFVGGVNGLISSAIEDGTAGLTFENFLGGAIRGFSKNEFRDVSLAVKGASDDIYIQNIKIAAPPKTDLEPELNEAERRREKEDEQIRLKVEFPVGPGEKKRGGDIGGQVGGQMLEQALGGIFSF
ncbi:MAG: AsmA-like C-terminal region-containing protein [Synergistaceae bacterium]|nr:AsmA-like C-terminal region-containing protein [Synergistaceae bacterium]